jgi:predicted dehydrogenase
MIRTAVLGLGNVAEHIHLPACLSVPELKIVAASDPRPERLIKMRDRFKIPALYEDSHELILKEQPDLVIVGTPPDSHKQLTLAALKADADVLCEKPFVLTVEDADEVVEAAKQANRMVAVNTQYRYMNQYRAAAEKIAAGEFGRLFFVQCWQQMFHPPVNEGFSWRASLKQSTLFEFGSHPIDLICFFMNALPEAITCHTPRVRAEYDADVLVQMTLRFPEERLATLALNRVSNAPERYLEMRLDCEKASLRASLGGVARAKVEITRFMGRNQPLIQLDLVKGGELRVEAAGTSQVVALEPRPAFAKATAAHIRDLIENRRLSKRPQHSVEHARDILQIIFAGYKSAQEGRTVELSRSVEKKLSVRV